MRNALCNNHNNKSRSTSRSTSRSQPITHNLPNETPCPIINSHSQKCVYSLKPHYTAPPASLEIQGYTNNAKVEVRESQELTLTCIVSDAKPAAQIQWFRKNVEYKPGNVQVLLYILPRIIICTVMCIRSRCVNGVITRPTASTMGSRAPPLNHVAQFAICPAIIFV